MLTQLIACLVIAPLLRAFDRALVHLDYQSLHASIRSWGTPVRHHQSPQALPGYEVRMCWG